MTCSRCNSKNTDWKLFPDYIVRHFCFDCGNIWKSECCWYPLKIE